MDSVCTLCERLLSKCCVSQGAQPVQIHVENHLQEVFLCHKCANKVRFSERLDELKRQISEALPENPPRLRRQHAQRGREMLDDDPRDRE
jgi:hypothetical protein